MADVLLIAGSPSIQSRSGAVITALNDRLEARGLTTHTIHIRDLNAQALLHADYEHAQIVDALDRVRRASVFIVATPIYKAAYSGLLKVFLDLLPQNALLEKAVLPVATAGSAAHLLAIDYALKPVLSALGTTQFLPSLYIQDTQITRVNPPTFDADIERRIDAAVDAVTLYFLPALPIEVGV